jgi:hypothetical protein
MKLSIVGATLVPMREGLPPIVVVVATSPEFSSDPDGEDWNGSRRELNLKIRTAITAAIAIIPRTRPRMSPSDDDSEESPTVTSVVAVARARSDAIMSPVLPNLTLANFSVKFMRADGLSGTDCSTIADRPSWPLSDGIRLAKPGVGLSATVAAAAMTVNTSDGRNGRVNSFDLAAPGILTKSFVAQSRKFPVGPAAAVAKYLSD